ncbi:MAG: DUF2141 domain-containing protein [Bacteroidetes bacterium]|nr:DUF2141 domain-containing protein [Bacteroidota bacterium]
MKFIIFILIAVLSGCVTPSKISINKETGMDTQVKVTLDGIKNNKGNLLVYIHNNAYSYYSDDDINISNITFYRKREIPATSPTAQVVFDKIPSGKYAITAVHDEDNDGQLDRMTFPFMGMPSESYGSSNASFSYLSKGAFEDALININSPKTNVVIKLSTHLNKIIGK